MTREVVLRTLKSILEEISESEDAVCYVNSEDREVIKSAIKALEQKPILNKIRAEILSRDEKVRAIRTDGHCFFTADEIIEIIDKYRQEG